MKKLRLTVTILVAAVMLPLLARTGQTTTTQKPSSPNRLKVGLVLGGGGAKGAAEVGILKYLEQSGIHVDYIAGTSIGSIVGGLWACGYKASQLDSMFRSQEWLDLLSDRNAVHSKKIFSMENGTPYIFGFPIGKQPAMEKANTGIGAIRGDNIVTLLDSMVACAPKRNHLMSNGLPLSADICDSLSFDELPTPFRCVAVDIKGYREVVLSSGSLPVAMRASMAIPGVFKTVNYEGMTLVDGGMLNNLPVDVVREMGADIVIAIDLTQNKPEDRTFSLRDMLGVGGLLDWAISRPDITKYNANRKDCDLYINPDLGDFEALSFSAEKIKKMIVIGEEIGKKYLPEMRKLRKRVEK